MRTWTKLNMAVLAILIAFALAHPSSVRGQELHEKGEKIFQEKACMSCHTIGGGKLVGPDLKGVTERRKEDWLRKWLKNPDAMLQTDPIAKEMLKQYLVPMPNQGLTDADIDALIAHFKHVDSEDED